MPGISFITGVVEIAPVHWRQLSDNSLDYQSFISPSDDFEIDVQGLSDTAANRARELLADKPVFNKDVVIAALIETATELAAQAEEKRDGNP